MIIFGMLYPKPNDEKREKEWSKKAIQKTFGRNSLKIAEEY